MTVHPERCRAISMQQMEMVAIHPIRRAFQPIRRLEEIAARHNVPMQAIGTVGGTRFIIQPLVQLPVEELKSIWSTGLMSRLR